MNKSESLSGRLIMREIESYLCATAFGKMCTQRSLRAAAKKIYRSGSLPRPVAVRLGLVKDAV
jgi:hypothetical protein